MSELKTPIPTTKSAPSGGFGVVGNKKLEENVRKKIYETRTKYTINHARIKTLRKRRIGVKHKNYKSLTQASAAVPRLDVVDLRIKGVAAGKAISMIGLFPLNAAKQKIQSSSVDTNNTTDTGSETMKAGAQTSKAVEDVTGSVKSISQKVSRTTKKVPFCAEGGKPAIKTGSKQTIKTAKKATMKTAANATKKASKAAATATTKAAKKAAKKVAKESAKALFAVKPKTPIGWIIILVAIVFMLVFMLSIALMDAIGGASGALEQTVGWILSGPCGGDIVGNYKERRNYLDDSLFALRANTLAQLDWWLDEEYDQLSFNGWLIPYNSATVASLMGTKGVPDSDCAFLLSCIYVFHLRANPAEKVEDLWANVNNDELDGAISAYYNYTLSLDPETFKCPGENCSAEWCEGECIGGYEICPGHSFCPGEHRRAYVTYKVCSRQDFLRLLNLSEKEKEQVDLALKLIEALIVEEEAEDEQTTVQTE